MLHLCRRVPVSSDLREAVLDRLLRGVVQGLLVGGAAGRATGWQDLLEGEVSTVADVVEGVQDLLEVYVPPTGSQAVRVGEVDVVEQASGRDRSSMFMW